MERGRERAGRTELPQPCSPVCGSGWTGTLGGRSDICPAAERGGRRRRAGEGGAAGRYRRAGRSASLAPWLRPDACVPPRPAPGDRRDRESSAASAEDAVLCAAEAETIEVV